MHGGSSNYTTRGIRGHIGKRNTFFLIREKACSWWVRYSLLIEGYISWAFHVPGKRLIFMRKYLMPTVATRSYNRKNGKECKKWDIMTGSLALTCNFHVQYSLFSGSLVFPTLTHIVMTARKLSFFSWADSPGKLHYHVYFVRYFRYQVLITQMEW